MWFHALFASSNLRSSPNTTRRVRRAADRRGESRRLFLESLEDRTLLSFLPVVNYGVAAYPLDMAVGDFNGDGKADLVTINATQVSVLPGNGDGAFGAAQTTAVGSGMRSVAAGDINGDGRHDLV